MKKLHIYFFVLTALIACNSKNEKSFNDAKEETVNEKLLNKFLGEAINEGNIASYDKVSSIFFEDNRYSDFYFYAMLMANKYKYPRAYYDLYIIMSRKGVTINDIQLYSNDNNTRKLANYFLLKSYELGLKEAFVDLKGIFGKNIPLSKEYLCEIERN